MSLDGSRAALPASAVASPVRGIALKLLSIAVFAVMSACVKAAREVAPAGEAVFFRSFVALAPVLAYAAWRGRVADAVLTRNIRAHFWRGLIGASAMGLSFAALGLLPLPEVIAISFAAPLLTVLLAIFLLGEVVRIYRWTALIVGLVGVVIMVWPRLTLIGEGVEPTAALGALVMLAAAFLMALAQIHVRVLAQSETTLAIVFWFHVSCSLAALLSLPWGWVWPGPDIWLLLIAAGLTGGIAQIIMTESYRRADASTLAPFDYSAMLWGLLIGWFVFAEVPEPMVLGGAGIVIAAGLAIFWRERRLGVLSKRGQARQAKTPL